MIKWFALSAMTGWAGAWILSSRNQLAVLRNRVDAAWSEIAVEAARRDDLVGDVLARIGSVDPAADNRLATADGIRVAALAANNIADFESAERRVRELIESALAPLREQRDLWADEMLVRAREGIDEICARIDRARSFYDDGVRRYNSALERAPLKYVARLFAFRPRPGLPPGAANPPGA